MFQVMSSVSLAEYDANHHVVGNVVHQKCVFGIHRNATSEIAVFMPSSRIVVSIVYNLFPVTPA